MNISLFNQTPFFNAREEDKEFPFKPQILSVSDFYVRVNSLLGLEEVIVEGEISEVKTAKGYLVYFSINDKESVLPCLLYKNKLDASGLPLEALEAGTTIRVRGYPNLYAKSGHFTFLVEKIYLVGEGALRRAFEVLKKKLEEEGLFRKDLKRPIPQYSEKIGLITSRGAAAYTDFIKVMRARWGGVKIYFYPASVQGESAVEEILAAFSYFNTDISFIDAIVLTRGGGSLEDLAAFNTEAVARAVRASKWPVICAVGHERDESLADFAADLRASTPSNAAELLTPTREEEKNYLQSLQKKVILHIESKIASDKHFFERALSIMERFFQKPKTELLLFQEQVERATTVWLTRMKNDIAQKERLLKSFDPQAVLKRGYSITTSEAGKIVTSIKDLSVGDNVKTSLHQGVFQSEVTEKL